MSWSWHLQISIKSPNDQTWDFNKSKKQGGKAMFLVQKRDRKSKFLWIFSFYCNCMRFPIYHIIGRYLFLMLILIKLSFLFEIALPEYLLLHQSVVVVNVKLQSNNFLYWFFCDDNTAGHCKNVEIMLFKSVLLSQSAALRSRTFLVNLRILLIWSWKLESY